LFAIVLKLELDKSIWFYIGIWVFIQFILIIFIINRLLARKSIFSTGIIRGSLLFYLGFSLIAEMGKNLGNDFYSMEAVFGHFKIA